jgi:hypothetical protein
MSTFSIIYIDGNVHVCQSEYLHIQMIPPAKRDCRRQALRSQPGRCRRLAKDFENLTVNARAFLSLAMIRLMPRRITRNSSAA